MTALIIAVDGPAAAGKGTLARRLAEALGLPYLDTGLLYRATARRMIEAGLDPAHHSGEAAALALEPADLARDDLRVPEIDRGASHVSSQPEVRAALLQRQRDFARAGGGVLDGRDIGTVIFPEAPVKLFITASAGIRARRRFAQLGGDPSEPGAASQIETVAREIEARDQADSARATAPLKIAEDAVVIETDEMDADAVLARALAVVRARTG